jgi:guanylate kinase
MIKKNIFLSLSIVFFTSINSTISATFLLIMGPSGTGKSTIINYLKKRDHRFVYISPLTTRNLREGEIDKIHMSLQEIEQLNKEGKILTINNFYNNYYATPKYSIDEALAQGNFPILDWPIEKLDIMNTHYHNKLYTVYIEPDNLDELSERLKNDDRDQDGTRYSAGVEEINKLHDGLYNCLINVRIINKKNCAEETAEEIYKKFLLFIAQHNENFN